MQRKSPVWNFGAPEYGFGNSRNLSPLSLADHAISNYGKSVNFVTTVLMNILTYSFLSLLSPLFCGYIMQVIVFSSK